LAIFAPYNMSGTPKARGLEFSELAIRGFEA